MTVFNNTFDVNAPDGGDDPAEADNNMRRIQAAVQERHDVDHYWELTGTQVSSAFAGEHRKITYFGTIADPTQVSGKSHLYMKTDELFYQDDDDTTLQMTNAGDLYSSAGLETVGNGLIGGTLTATGAAVLSTSVDINSTVVVVGTLDDDTMGTATDTTLPTSESITAYTDSSIATSVAGVGFWKYDATEVFNDTLTAANTFQDLDLSAVVGTNRALAFLHVTVSAGDIVVFRMKGETGAYAKWIGGADSQAGINASNLDVADAEYYASCMTDASGVIQIAGSTNTTTYVVTMRGYVK